MSTASAGDEHTRPPGGRHSPYDVVRLGDGPIVDASTHPSIGSNIQGPSLVRMPAWLPGRLGRYHLYFADHKGTYIRLAHAEELHGPWTVHEPGSLHLAESRFATEPPPHTPEQLDRIRARFAARGGRLLHDVGLEVITPHIASPDVHVRDDERRMVMYFHGLESLARQVTRVATSRDGLAFDVHPEIVEDTYLRVVRRGDHHLGLAMPGRLYRSVDGISGWERGPLIFEPDMRHNAIRLLDEHTLEVFWTRVGDAPERILRSTVDLRGPWDGWSASAPVEVLRPERSWEGAGAAVEPSLRSVAYGIVNQLRDPALYEEDGRTYLLYAAGGESGIAIAELVRRDGGGR